MTATKAKSKSKTSKEKESTTPGKRLTTYQKLSKPIIQTKNKHQACVDRFNEVCGVDGWGFNTKVVKERMVNVQGSAHRAYEICMAVAIWVGAKENIRAASSGSISGMYSDGVDEATTKAFVKASKLWGVGKDFDDESESPEVDNHEPMETYEEPTFQESIEEHPGLEEMKQAVPPQVPLESSTELIKRYESESKQIPQSEKTASQLMAEEDGAPPVGAPRTRVVNQPSLSKQGDPNAPFTEEQKKIIIGYSRELGIPKEKTSTFISSNPTQAQAASVMSNLRQQLKVKKAFEQGARV